jgi:DNA-binding beta-propeller fold protein YncE
MKRLVVACALAAAGALSLAQTVEQGGVQLRYSTPADAAVARFEFTDSASGAALSGLRPAAWMQLRRSPAELETPCEDRARQFVAGSLGARADIDLNAYRLVTLNQDDTIAFINPQVRIRNSRLEAIVALPGRGHDWAYSDSARLIAVTLREAGQLAVVDAVAHRLLGVVDLGRGSLPTRLVIEPGGQRAWVGLDGADAIALVDLASRKEISRVAVGRGPHTLATVPGRPWLVAAHAESAQASLIDMPSGQRIGQVAVAAGPVAVAYSPAAQRAVVLSGKAGELALLALSDDSLRVDGRIALDPGALSLATLGDGRHLLVGNVVTHQVSLVDLAQRTVRDRADVPPWPDQITSTRDFAYVRSQTSATVTMFGIERARAGKLQPVQVPIGRAAPSDLAEAINVAPLMAPAPEGNGIYAAVAADAQLYRYTEGLMVPSGSLSNYRRAARGLLVIDESLRERGNGRFEAPLRVERSGTYDVVVRNASPSFSACFSVALQAAVGERIADVVPPKPRLLSWRQDGQRLEIEVALHGADGRPLAAEGDLQALLYAAGGAWQRRAPMRAGTDGRWTAALELPAGADASQAELLLQSARHGLAFTRGRVGALAGDARRDGQEREHAQR